MTAANRSYRHHIDEALRVLNGRWVAAVLTELAPGPLHFSQLLSRINSTDTEDDSVVPDKAQLTGKVLTQTLRRMEANGLVARHRQNKSFPQVWYELTPMARTLLRSLRSLVEWAQAHEDELAESRDQTAQSPSGAVSVRRT